MGRSSTFYEFETAFGNRAYLRLLQLVLDRFEDVALNGVFKI